MVNLEIIFEEYGRYDDGGQLHRATIKSDSLEEAIRVMVDNVGLYADREEVDDRLEDGETIEDIINSIAESNGDGCDMIYLLKDLISGKVYIDDYIEEDEW